MAYESSRIHRHTEAEIKKLGEQCLKLREQHGIKNNRLAERFGVSPAAVQRWIEKARK